MGHAQRMRVAGVLTSAAHLACGLIGWVALGLPGAMLLFGLCAAISLALALVASLLMHPPHEGEGGSPPPPGGDDPPEPPWWPEFERDFWADAARERAGA